MTLTILFLLAKRLVPPLLREPHSCPVERCIFKVIPKKFNFGFYCLILPHVFFLELVFTIPTKDYQVLSTAWNCGYDHTCKEDTNHNFSVRCTIKPTFFSFSKRTFTVDGSDKTWFMRINIGWSGRQCNQEEILNLEHSNGQIKSKVRQLSREIEILKESRPKLQQHLTEHQKYENQLKLLIQKDFELQDVETVVNMVYRGAASLSGEFDKEKPQNSGGGQEGNAGGGLVFGVELDVAMAHKSNQGLEVPRVVSRCFTHLTAKGM